MADVKGELIQLVARSLPVERADIRRFRALCLRRDVRALGNAMPSHRLSEVPQSLHGFRAMDAAIFSVLKVLDKRMADMASGLPLNSLFGAWEGGLPAREVPLPSPHGSLERPTCKCVLSAFNIRGALCREGGLEAHEGRLLQLSASLHAGGVVVAILSEPKLAPGMIWPTWTGYSFLGERTSAAGSVAALVLQEVSGEIIQIEGVGDERAIWLEVPFSELHGGDGGTLVLGVYGHQISHATAIRRGFWRTRLKEVRELRRRQRYCGWEVAVLGDFNLHLSSLGLLNKRYERAVDKEVMEMLLDPDGFGCTLRNPVGVQTHSSGTIIDVIAVSAGRRATVQVVSGPAAGVPSDHSRIDVELHGRVAVGSPKMGSARWHSTCDGDWDTALLAIPKTLQFMAGWAGAAMRDQTFRGWADSGRKPGTSRGFLTEQCGGGRCVSLCVVISMGWCLPGGPSRPPALRRFWTSCRMLCRRRVLLGRAPNVMSRL